MSKKSRLKHQHTKLTRPQANNGEAAKELSVGSAISKRGKKTIFSGIAIVILGFIILSLADPEGRNLASTISPFVIIAGYITIGIGIILPDKNIASPDAASPALVEKSSFQGEHNPRT